ncbi:MAG TPA: hypothetical protein VN836_08345 [Verrucomicrobiae bacterium]|nr:hypothetical protein [Verrucomicrobiae bacterium]
MQKPDSQEFARQVLWHLASLRAELAHLRMDFEEKVAQTSKAPPLEGVQKWKAKNRFLQVKLYKEALHEAGIPEDKSPPSPSDLLGGNGDGGYTRR